MGEMFDHSKKHMDFMSRIAVGEAIVEGAKQALLQFNDRKAQQPALRPALLSNRDESTYSSVVADSFIGELRTCKAFYFAVAFITEDGLDAIKASLRTVLDRGVHGRILISTMNHFNKPKVMRQLLQLSMDYEGLSIRVFEGPKHAPAYRKSMHVKGYFFEHEHHSTLIVGSTNLTKNGLHTNREWNIKLSSLDTGAILQEGTRAYEALWAESTDLSESWIDDYENLYKEEMAAAVQPVRRFHRQILVPNTMQEKALASLKEQRLEGARRSLLISATGTGKTYLSAFDVKSMGAKRILFIAHRERLLTQAQASYATVIGNSQPNMVYAVMTGKTMEKEGLLTELAQKDSFSLFTTNNLLAREKFQCYFRPDTFDYIVIDEAHHSVTGTYKAVLDYFKPKFILGMTATPERLDQCDVYEVFDHNIAYEIRLQDAQAYDLLCPFHYYGIDDGNFELVDDFRHSDYERRAQFILDKAEEYAFVRESWSQTRALVFCSRIEEARALAAAFTAMGHPSAAVVGGDKQGYDRAIASLESDDKGRLEFIFSVDMINEGVDIPAVNLIIMLRPTDSAIVFVQQLGRGLRKHESKDFVRVMDFVGNNEKNYMIAVALSGDRTANRERLRRYIGGRYHVLDGRCLITFEEKSRHRIYASINRANMSTKRMLYDEYKNLKCKLGRIPKIMDFEEYHSIEMLRYFESFGNYPAFLQKKEPACKHLKLTVAQDDYLTYICKHFAKGLRLDELLVLRDFLTGESSYIEGSQTYVEHMSNLFEGSYYKSSPKLGVVERGHMVVVGERQGAENKETVYRIKVRRDEAFAKALSDDTFIAMVKEVVDYGIYRYERYYRNRYKDSPFVLEELYTREEVARLLCWNADPNAQTVGGYYYDKKTNTLPVYINYKEIDENLNDQLYDDHFISPSQLVAYSKNGASYKTMEEIFGRAEEKGTKIYLFVNKKIDDGVKCKQAGATSFYFLGEMRVAGAFEKRSNRFSSSGKDTHAFAIPYELDQAVNDDLYEYITRETISV